MTKVMVYQVNCIVSHGFPISFSVKKAVKYS